MFLLALLLPLTTTAFLVIPQRGHAAVAWVVMLLGIGLLDELVTPARPARPAPSPRFARFLTLTLAGVQLANVGLFVARVSSWGIVSLDAALAIVLVGVGSAMSSMIVAHELIHQRSTGARWLGRALLQTLLYDHFFTDHLRGHHRHVGTAQDALTARYGETFAAYLLRTWPAELASAWRIEARRHGQAPFALAVSRSQVARGMVLELSMLVAVTLALGAGAALALVAQAAIAQLLTMTVNYFEHWGIVRSERQLGGVVAWDSAARWSHQALLGLPFHSDHHAHASHSFERLAWHQESPQLPRGYFGMVALVLLDNAKARALLSAELVRKGLAPSTSSAHLPDAAFSSSASSQRSSTSW